MSETKLVKVDNWGIFFLQRLKHFFNRTDYCDLTLQFQDNAQLKVHRLVLSACTEYFELLERTCEMYEDCLVMPDDLQADVVVPIVNFMYTGQLEFRMDLLERLYQTAVVMKMTVLTKLLDTHRVHRVSRETPCHSYTNPKKHFKQFSSPSSSSAVSKRSYSKAFSSYKSSDFDINNMMLYGNADPLELQNVTPKKQVYLDPRPTRYELPEELETENLFENSFSNISYTSKPLMVHPETTKRYPAKRSGIFEDPTTSKRLIHGHSTVDIVECKKISANENIFGEDPTESFCDDPDTYGSTMSKSESRNSSQLFDQILDTGGPKVTIETKDNKQANNLDHAKIISEVLKKYPHLVKSNKNIKLKILNTPTKKKVPSPNGIENQKETKIKPKVYNSYSYESDVLDSKKAAQLIVLGAENVNGPWICLICGAPGKAIHFASYYQFRRHLVEVHNEKAIPSMCEYCGQKATKRNYMLHHLYTKHGVEPPPNISFPKCNICSYIALTEGLLIKHKLSHVDNQSFRCNVCAASFSASNKLLVHIQKTGHKYSDRKTNSQCIQCIYCLKLFSRECNLYAHLRKFHKESAKNDGVIDLSDDENEQVKEKEKVTIKPPSKPEVVKYELPVTFSNEYDDADIQYQIQQQPDGNIQLFSKKPKVLLPAKKHKILNAGFEISSSNKKEENLKLPTYSSRNEDELVEDSNISMETQTEELVMIDENDYVLKDNHLILKQEKSTSAMRGFSMPDLMHTDIEEPDHISTSVEFRDVETVNPEENKMVLKKTDNINQPIQIVVSNEEEYKALMASNHSIIFEEGGAGKTLTVLTAPHDNNTTIDLGSTQPNDMMIIQDNYPLNVSQAVSGENSNIVVVYSHAVEDQNKQFQLNLGEQFVTSSGIITQNFETVTTSAAIMNTHIIDTPIEDSWQNSIQQNINPETEIEIPLIDNQVTIAPTGDQQSCINEPEKEQLAPDSCKAVEIQEISENVMNQATIEHSNTEEIIAPNVSEADHVMDDSQLGSTSTSETQPVFINSVIETNLEITDCNQVVGESYDSDQLNQKVPHKEKNPQNNILGNNLIEQEVEAEPPPHKQVSGDFQGTNTEESVDSETIENIAKEVQLSAPTPTIPIDTLVQASVDIDPINSIKVSMVEANEQIKNLASEWSDDEMETSSQEPNSSQEAVSPKDIPESEAMETDSQADLEESIENIQNEMEKQLAQPVPSVLQKVVASNKTEDSFPNNKTIVVHETKPVQTTVASESSKTPVKISSLLNDWEDNEDNDGPEESVNGDDDTEKCADNPIIPAIDIQNTDNVNVVPDTHKTPQTTPENDKIKSLVSDWVEEDEEEEVENSK